MGAEGFQCPICGAQWQPGVSHWRLLPAAPGCRPARGWHHDDPRTRNKRHPRRCCYTDGEAIHDAYAPPPMQERGVQAA